MKAELLVSSHAVGESNYHIQLTPAYRRDIFADETVAELTLGYILQKLRQHKVVLAAYGFGPDHLHLFVKQWKNWKIPVLAGQLKTYSSRMMRKHNRHMFVDKLWGNKFWSSGYFHITVGAVTAETVKRYIAEGQKKHWEEAEQKQQRTLFNYAA